MDFTRRSMSITCVLRYAAIVIATVAFVTGCNTPFGIKVNQKVTGVTLSQSSVQIAVGSTEQLSATVAPSNASNKVLSWSSDSASASVSTTGLVAAIAPGSAAITVKTMDGSYTASCLVTIVIVPVTGVALNMAAASIGVGLSKQLEATISPANATNRGLSWSSNSANASVSSTGLVTAQALGSATITVTTADGSFTASCAVTVIPVPVTGVTLDKSSLALTAGQSGTLSATIAPLNAANQAVSWSSSATSIAAISEGTVLGLAAGTATITATTADGSFTASCLVTVAGSLAHSYLEVLPAATALQNGLDAALASNDSSATAYYAYNVAAMTVTCHLQGYASQGYTLSGTIVVNVKSDYTQGAMNGTVAFSGGIVTEITYNNAVFSAPKSGSMSIKFNDGGSGTLDLATSSYSQN
jgi:uncharacterized protein YjdB